MMRTVVLCIVSALIAGALTPEVRSQCNGDPGFTLDTNPAQVEIGDTLTFTLDTPNASLATWFFSTGQGPVTTPFGQLCLDFPTVLNIALTVPDQGLALSNKIPCDSSLVGLDLYHQFIAFNLSDPTDVGISNQSFLSFTSSSHLCALYRDFSDQSQLQLNGNANIANNKLRLTVALLNQIGSAFYTSNAPVDSNTSFETKFQFRMFGAVDGADGMTFMIQGNDDSQLGMGGPDLGYGGIGNSVAIEIDTNQTGSDPDGNHIGVLVAGNAGTHLATYTPAFDLENSRTHTLWVEFTASTKILNVYLDEGTPVNRPPNPVISVPNFDFATTIGTGVGFVGFSAATGGSIDNYHEVRKWEFRIGNY